MSEQDSLTAPIAGAERKTVGGVVHDIVRVGNGRICRTIYYPGFTWEGNMHQAVKADLCMHAHVGFLARGRLEAHFPDGCRREYVAPAVVFLEPRAMGRWLASDGPILFGQGIAMPAGAS